MGEINSSDIEVEELRLAAHHPGIGDTDYIRRRNMFFYLARDLRLRELPAQDVSYTEEEKALWQNLSERLDTLHQKAASKIYLDGKVQLGLRKDLIPQLSELDPRLHAATGIKLVPAEGLLHGKVYFKYWSQKIMPCTLFFRHGSEPIYTPEPDIVHDVIGHVPPLMNKRYVELIQMIGKLSQTLEPVQLERLVRFYWFTIEFGLVQEQGKTKILGAGILSSVGETEHVLRGDAQVRPFELEEVLSTAFDPTVMQPVLFEAPSLDFIIDTAQRLPNLL